MNKPVGKESVRSAVQRIYPELPLTFSMMKLHAMVCREIRRPYLYLDTTRRKLFELREEKEVFFENIDKAKSLYHKLERL
jgi:hypothetical protein